MEQTLLNGMPLNEFFGFMFWAIIGMLMSFGFAVRQAIRKSTTTPNHWSWSHFWKGMYRVVFTILVMGVAVVFWEEISKLFFDSITAVELTPWSAFWIIGVGCDKLTETIFGGTKDVYAAGKNVIKKK